VRTCEVASVSFTDTDGRILILGDVMDAWAGHVLRLWRECDTSYEETPGAWGAHDLVAALYIRDRVGVGLVACGCDQPTLPVVDATDELYKSFTVEDEGDSLLLVGYEVPRSPWWWRRVPARGPVVVELAEIAKRRARPD
jgi:hypothetical protein